ncbi:MAG: beta-propeller domain-containing protein [Proteobacteria bacterium]|nr:beta-propeller domain-containing protein [Pseudomonadota bacterium]
MKKLAIFALSLSAIAAMSACSDSNDNNSFSGYKPIDITSKQLALTKAASCDDYRNHVLDGLAMAIAKERFEGYYYWGPMEDVAVDAEPSAAEEPGSVKEESAGEYTTTNVQEAGVDELDTVKNDGNYMYTIRDNEIHISKIWPVTDMKEVATIEREKVEYHNQNTDSWFSPAGIFLTDDKKLIDIGQRHIWHYDNEDDWFGHYTGLVNVRIFDVSNPSSPKLLKRHQLEGEFVDARLIDNRLHLVSSATPTYNWYDAYKLSKEDIPGVPKFYDPYDDENFRHSDWSSEEWSAYYQAEEEWYNKRDEHIAQYLPAIRAWLDEKYPTLEAPNWPNYYDGKTVRPAVGCTDLYIPAVASQKEGFLLVSEFTGSNYENYQATAIADDGWLVYASQKNLYISSFSYNWWWSCGADECENYTHIHHFNLGNQQGDVQYINSAEINGIANDSFYYSEYKDHLRVFSGENRWWNASEKGHKLSVLDINTPSVMTQTGFVEGFGKNERIYSARMVGDRGYVVTFRNTDPLFVFDLSNPANPKQTGELKINGYSSYIHPVGKDHLLTIGEDGDDDGNLNGMKLDLYDVSNPANPVLKYQTKINEEKYEYDGETSSGSYGWSDAMYNHHAFQYHEGSGLLAIPVNIRKWSHSYKDHSHSYERFSGMFVYRVKPDSDFEFLGGVDHADLVGDEKHWWTSVNRSRFYFKTAGVYDKDAYIYTISNHGLKASDANDPDKSFGVIKY